MLQWACECRYLFETVISFPLDAYPEVEWLVALFLIFWGTSILFPMVAFYILTNNTQVFPFLHILINIWYLFPSWRQPSKQAGGDISQWLVCISLVTSDVQHLFMYLLTMLVWSLKVILCLALLCHPPYICSCYSKLGLGVERGLTSWRGFPGGAVVKNLPANAGDTRDERDMRSIPGLGRSPGEGNGNLLQYSCLGNPVDRGAWWATVHGVSRRTEDAHVSFLEASFILILSTCSTVDPWASRAPSFTDFSSIYLYLVNYKRARASTSARVQSCAAAAADF